MKKSRAQIGEDLSPFEGDLSDFPFTVNLPAARQLVRCTWRRTHARRASAMHHRNRARVGWGCVAVTISTHRLDTERCIQPTAMPVLAVGLAVPGDEATIARVAGNGVVLVRVETMQRLLHVNHLLWNPNPNGVPAVITTGNHAARKADSHDEHGKSFDKVHDGLLGRKVKLLGSYKGNHFHPISLPISITYFYHFVNSFLSL